MTWSLAARIRLSEFSGAITDTALGIINQSVTGLIPIAPVVPLPDFVTAPDFSYISVPNGVPSPPANQAQHYALL